MEKRQKEKQTISRQQVLLTIYNTQWEDVHHTRDQDWELSRLILVGFIGLSGLTAFNAANMLIDFLGGGFIAISILGILVTIRHKIVFKQKIDVITKIEAELEVNDIVQFPKPGKAMSLFTTQNILICMYSFTAMIFSLFLFINITP